LILLLILIDPRSTSTPFVIVSIVACTVMSLCSLRTLLKRILPGRAAYPAPQARKQSSDGSQKICSSSLVQPGELILCHPEPDLRRIFVCLSSD
jgi:hypothetical protein